MGYEPEMRTSDEVPRRFSPPAESEEGEDRNYLVGRYNEADCRFWRDGRSTQRALCAKMGCRVEYEVWEEMKRLAK